DRCAAGPGQDLAAHPRDAHLEALVVGERVDLLPEPAAHLRAEGRAEAGEDAEGRVGLLPEPAALALVVPGPGALRVQAEGPGHEPLDGWFPRGPIGGRGHEALDRALRRRIEALEGGHDLAGRIHLDVEAASAHLVDDLAESNRGALHDVELLGPGGGQPPL